MSLKNKRTVTVLVPVEALLYEDEVTGETVCGGVTWPDLKKVRDYAAGKPPILEEAYRILKQRDAELDGKG